MLRRLTWKRVAALVAVLATVAIAYTLASGSLQQVAITRSLRLEVTQLKLDRNGALIAEATLSYDQRRAGLLGWFAPGKVSAMTDFSLDWLETRPAAPVITLQSNPAKVDWPRR